MNERNNKEEQPLFYKHIYAMQNDLGEVKIGVTRNINARKRAIESHGGRKITRIHNTPLCSNAFEIEHKAHEYFKDDRVVGEWFSIEFDTAVDYIDKAFSDYAKFETYIPDDSEKIMEFIKKLNQPFYGSALAYVLHNKVGDLIVEIADTLSQSDKSNIDSFEYRKLNNINISFLYAIFEYASLLNVKNDYKFYDELLEAYDNCEILDCDIDILVDGISLSRKGK